MGSFFNNVPFPVFEEQKPKYWTDTIKWIFEEEKEKPGVKKGKEDAPEAPVEKLKIYIPKSCDDCQILAKDALLAPQLQNELDSGQVVEMVATFKERCVKMVLGYNAELKKWLIVYFNDGKVAK